MTGLGSQPVLVLEMWYCSYYKGNGQVLAAGRQDRPELVGPEFSSGMDNPLANLQCMLLSTMLLCCMRVVCVVGGQGVGWAKPAVGRKIPSLNWLDP